MCNSQLRWQGLLKCVALTVCGAVFTRSPSYGWCSLCICPEGSRVASEDDWNGVLIRCESLWRRGRRVSVTFAKKIIGERGVYRMSNRKRRETKQQPNRARPGHQLSCCLVPSISCATSHQVALYSVHTCSTCRQLRRWAALINCGRRDRCPISQNEIESRVVVV